MDRQILPDKYFQIIALKREGAPVQKYLLKGALLIGSEVSSPDDMQVNALPLTGMTLMLYILVKQKDRGGVMPLAKLSSKSQVVLPAKIRRKLGINPGDMIEITEQNEKIILRKAPTSFLRELEFCCSETWQDYERELQQEREEWDH